MNTTYRKQIYRRVADTATDFNRTLRHEVHRRTAVTSSTRTFYYTGDVQTYDVPSVISSIGVGLYGAAGGSGVGGTAGYGALVVTTLAVTPGSTLFIYCGGKGSTATVGKYNAGGFNGGGRGYYGGGGGGGTDIRNGTEGTIYNRMAVAGGGGGVYSTAGGGNGGNGGAPNGAAGTIGSFFPGGAVAGKGGTQTSGGAATGQYSTAGALFQGGDGGLSGACGGGGGYYGRICRSEQLWRRVVSWGSAADGGDSSVVAHLLTNVNKVVECVNAFAALKTDGTVVTWGQVTSTAGCSAWRSGVNMTSLYATEHTFAGLTATGGVYVCGAAGRGGRIGDDVRPMVEARYAKVSNGVQFIWPGKSAFVAYNAAHGIAAAWGLQSMGGDLSSVQSEVAANVISVAHTDGAFAALKEDGSVVTWGSQDFGGDSSAVTSQLQNIKRIYSNGGAFAALNTTGGVVTWGDSASGGLIYSN
eukprot:gene28822-35752_t